MPATRTLTIVAIVIGAVDCQQAKVPPASSGETGANAVLERLATAVHEREIAASLSLSLKHRRPIEALADISIGRDRRDSAFAVAMLDSLGVLPREGLGSVDLASAEVLEWGLRNATEAPKYHHLSFGFITPYQSPLTNDLLALGRELPLDTSEDRARFLARLGEGSRLMDSVLAELAARAELGIRLPKPEIGQIVSGLRALSRPGLTSPFAPRTERLSSIPDSVRPSFQTAVVKIIDDGINPSLARVVAALGGEYLRKAPTEVGLMQYPGGEEYYRHLVKVNTTLAVPPEEIHQIGLRELARLEAGMDSIQQALGFRGTRKQFQDQLRADPRFKAKTPEDVGARYQKFYDAIKPLLPQLFSKMPKAPAEFRRLNPALEAASTYGYYAVPTPATPVGIYYYNASNLANRSLFSVGPIAFHELAPGHHFQAAIADESAELPAFRKDFYSNAFGEGWAEYAAGLAGELGLYADPYDRYARLVDQAFLSNRLVVDPGMNLLGWSRAKAIQFFREHTMAAESEIASETLRYSVDLPGQALGYRMGELEFLRLREKAKEALGAKFDIRQWHDLLLEGGNLPMAVLGRSVDRWIASQKP